MPADHPLFCTWDINDCMEIVRRKDGTFDPEPSTLGRKFYDNSHLWGEFPAFVDKDDKTLSYLGYYNEAERFAKALIHIGFKIHDVVCDIGFNSPEYLISLQGTWLIGCAASGIYTTNSPDACRYVLDHSEAKVCVCEGGRMAEKIASIRNLLPNLKAIVVYWPEAGVPTVEEDDGFAKVYTWDNFMKLGEDIKSEEVMKMLDATDPGHCASLIYTSGTTGEPKAVMCSHDNCVFNSLNFKSYACLHEENRWVSYLPLNHIAAQYLDAMIPACYKVTVSICRPDALRGTLAASMRKCQPTFFMGVPRVWEKFADTLGGIMNAATGTDKIMYDYARKVGMAACQTRQFGQTFTKPDGYEICDQLVFTKFRTMLGLTQCNFFAVSAAPVADETLKFFCSLDWPLFDIFGQSEGTAPICFSTPNASRWKMFFAGRPMSGITCVTDPITSELFYRGRHVMMGYLKMQKETLATIDNQGWLHTGDQAIIDEDGFVRITGRLKELIVTAGGENISPVPIESKLMELCPIIASCVVIGDKRQFLSCLIALKAETNPVTGEPGEKLLPVAVETLKALGSTSTTITEARSDPIVARMIDQAIEGYNQVAISRAANIRKWIMLDRDLSIGRGELTATLKLKRAVVHRQYEKEISEMYQNARGSE